MLKIRHIIISAIVMLSMANAQQTPEAPTNPPLDTPKPQESYWCRLFAYPANTSISNYARAGLGYEFGKETLMVEQAASNAATFDVSYNIAINMEHKSRCTGNIIGNSRTDVRFEFGAGTDASWHVGIMGAPLLDVSNEPHIYFQPIIGVSANSSFDKLEGVAVLLAPFAIMHMEFMLGTDFDITDQYKGYVEGGWSFTRLESMWTIRSGIKF